eukprot:SM000058S18482  [mRNA]  locus=s58:84607:90615:+ [translate_table: standard]
MDAELAGGGDGDGDDGQRPRWPDAGPFFAQVCRELKPGELVHGENFSLFEAMSALEIMDAKMDAGMKSGGFRSADEAIASGAAPVDLTTEQLIDVIDQILACEAMWHAGSSMAQTIYTCLYLLRLDRTESNVLLHAYCRMVRATCSLIRNTVSQADIHEEEDFSTMSYGLPLVEGESDGKCVPLLNAVEETLMRQLNAAEKHGSPEDYEKVPGKWLPGDQQCHHLLMRLRFRKALHEVFTSINQPQCEGLPAARKHIMAATEELKKLKLLKCNEDQEPQALTHAVDGSLQAQRDTSSPSHSVPQSEDQLGCPPNTSSPHTIAGASPRSQLHMEPALPAASSSLPTSTPGEAARGTSVDDAEPCTCSGRPALGFEERVNRRLLAPTPPRPIRLYSWRKTLEAFEHLLSDLDRLCTLPHIITLEELQQFINDFQLSNPGPIARAQVELVVLREGKVLGLQPAANYVYHALGLSQETFSSDALISGFVAKATRPCMSLLKILCANSARRRRKLVRTLLEWDQLIVEAETAQDSKKFKEHMLASYAQQDWWTENRIVSFTVEQTCRIIAQYLLLGFSSNLYSPPEYLMIYWYLDHVLSTLVHNQGTREVHTFHKKAIGQAKKAKKKKTVTQKPSQPADYQPSIDMYHTYVYSELCKAYIGLLTGLELDHKVSYPMAPFNTEEERYIQRFGPLDAVRVPEPAAYSTFKRHTARTHTSVPQQYHLALEHFHTVGQYLHQLHGRLQASTDMPAVVTRNMLALKIAHRTGPGPTLKATFDFSHHVCFPVAVLKRS